jgi:serine protease Do
VARGNVGVGFAVPIDAIDELLPALRTGKVTRGRIGVQITPVTRDLVEPLGLEAAAGALVRQVDRGGPAARAGIEPGDVIVAYNGEPVKESDDLVVAVARTTPGTSVPVEVMRATLRQTLKVTVGELETSEAGGDTFSSEVERFGLTLGPITPEAARRLNVPEGQAGALVTSVERDSPAARAGIRGGDVILEVNREAVTGVDDAVARLRESVLRTTFLLLSRQGQEVFVTVAPPS